MNIAKTADLTHGPFLQKMTLFAIPVALSSMLQLLFNAADVVVMGRFAGSRALAAVSLTGSLVGLITNLFIGLSIGANVIAARYLGARDDEMVRQTVSTSVVLSFWCGVCMTLIGQLAARPMLAAMSAPADVIDLSTLYLRIFFFGMPASMMYNFGSALLRAAGDTRRPLYCLSAAGTLNIVLNLVFVIVFRMSVAGVALATILSQGLSCVLVLALLRRTDGPLHLSWKELRIYPRPFAEIVRIGLPAGIYNTIASFSNVIIQSALNTFGSVVVAGNGAAGNIEGFIYVAMNAFSQACITFTSQNYGARSYAAIKKLFWIGESTVLAAGIALGALLWTFSGPLLGIYSTDPAVIAAGQERMAIICRCYFLCGLMDVLVGALRGIGYSFIPMVFSLAGSCGMRLLWIFTVFAHARTITVLYLCYPIGWVVTILALFPFFWYAYRKMCRAAAPPP